VLVSPITIVPPYYIPPHMHNFEESNFVVSEYNHSLDHEEVQHLVETLFEGMHFLTKQGVQHALQQYHVSKGVNYMTQLLNPTKLIVICDDNSFAWRCRVAYIPASKWCEIRKLYKSHTCSNPSISQDHIKFSYLLINKSINTLIENNPSTLVLALIPHIKSTEGYTTTYWKAWLAKQKTIENIYDN